ncbi:hypothetical protein FV222_09190 [Methylobacterium sp. WL103]|uniref:hypothetical protein n=1 Tax=Methylobacterium sp. WL103 TaxID=2603891 RepID=UPI0011D95755|nr:hypothetical protein [Methylobacterium sp. WL103]TXN02797.1 hypothetical protein FV222_09190 [Methylobacterium sp. WL103]
MKNKEELSNDIHVMNSAMALLDHHFTFICPDDEGAAYGKTRQDYLQKGIVRYEETSGEQGSVVQSLLNLFSAVYSKRSDKEYGVVLTDIRDELSRIAYNV